MKLRQRTCLACVLLLWACLPAGAELGWTRGDYAREFGAGERGFGKADEMGYAVGDSRLVAEFLGDRSVAEVWLLGVARHGVPRRVLDDAAAAARGRFVKRVEFEARGALPAEIHEAAVGDAVVRVDVRNQLVTSVAYCGRLEPCAWWRRLLGWCPKERGCDILERILEIDRTVDRLHAQAERAMP